jgi:hypothetical protein
MKHDWIYFTREPVGIYNRKYTHLCVACGLDIHHYNMMTEKALEEECKRQGHPYDDCDAYKERTVAKVMDS